MINLKQYILDLIIPPEFKESPTIFIRIHNPIPKIAHFSSSGGIIKGNMVFYCITKIIDQLI